MALAHQYSYMHVQIGTVDFTPYLANVEQIATLAIGSEVGRATLTFRDDGSLPTIPKWGTVVIAAGTATPGTTVWGGYATRQSSEPVSMHGGTVRMLTVDCQSYSLALSTTPPITETYGGGDNDSLLLDYVIVDDLVQTYLPTFYDAGSISSAGPVQCDYIKFSDESLRSALNKITERGAKDFGITANGDFYFRPVGAAGTVAHELSDAPNSVSTFPMQAKPYSDRDDVKLRNAVKVTGGWSLSAVQTETFLTDGVLSAFVVDYFPQEIIRVTLANVVQSVGVYLVDDPADFDVLVHYDQHKFIYQLAPTAGKTLEIVYRYPVRVEEIVTNPASIAEVGGTIWAPTIQDSSISQQSVALLAGSVYLASVATSIARGQLTTTWVGTAESYLPGQVVKVTTGALGWSSEDLEIQAVTMRFAPRPGGDGVCLTYWDLDVGTPITIGRNLGDTFLDAADIRTKTHIPDIYKALSAIDIPELDHGSDLTGLSDDDHPQYLLATGTRTGASSQAQTFTNGIIGPIWRPASDSTTALQMQNAAGTAIATIDTTNSRLVLASGVSIFSASNSLLQRYGTNNLFLGIDAGNFTMTTAVGNAGIGAYTLASLTTGDYNAAFGSYALNVVSSGSNNLAIGSNSLASLTSGHRNVAMGYSSQESNALGIDNVAVGQQSLNAFAPATAVGKNVAIGSYALQAMTSGTGCVAIGHQAGYSSTGKDEIYIGYRAGYYETGDAKLIISSQTFGSETADRVGAIIYGEMNATVASQILRVNAQLQAYRLSSTTAAADNVVVIDHNSSGTPANGFGAGLAFTLKSSTTANQSAARIVALWDAATHGSRKADLILYASDYTAEREGFRIHTTGSAVQLGFWGSVPAARQTLSSYTTDDQSADYSGIDNSHGTEVYAQVDDLNTLRAAYENLRGMVDELRSAIQNTTLIA